MQIAKWGNSLAVRLPSALVQGLGLKIGDELNVVEATKADKTAKLAVVRKPTRKELIENLRKFRGTLPAGYRFSREDANER